MPTKQERDYEHQKILEEVLASRDDLAKGRNPLPYYVVATLLVMLLVLWVLPSDSFPARAKLSAIPTLEEAIPEGMSIPPRPESNNINAYVTHEDPNIKLIAANIVTSACSKEDKRCYADALFHFTKENTRYLSDPIGEYYEMPQETLLAGAADCDGHAILLASLLRSVGILTQFSYAPRHVAVEAWLPSNHLFSKQYTYEWVHYDATCKECRPGEHMPLLQ